MGDNTEVSNVFHFRNFLAERKYTALVGLFLGYSGSFVEFDIKSSTMPLQTSILRVFFAIRFLFSAYTKFVAPGFFEITLMDQNIANNMVWAAQLTRFLLAWNLAWECCYFFQFIHVDF